MKRKIFVLIILPLFFPTLVLADTVVGDIFIDDIQTWTLAESPYIIPNVSGGDIVITEGGILNIEAGVVVKANNARKFDVYGTLNILGEQDNPVLMTNTIDEAPNASDRWGGIVFYDGSLGNLNYLEMRYSGLVQFYPGGVAILNQGGDVSINNSKFVKNFSAIEIKSGTTTISDALIDQNNVGISFESGDLSLSGSTVSNSTSYGFISANSAPSRFFARDNIFMNNRNNANLNLGVDFDIASTTFSGGDFSAWVISGSPSGNKTLKPIDNGPIVSGGIFIQSGDTLDIEAGTIIKGGFLINRGGILNARGTKEKPVILTSAADDDVGGDTNNDGSGTNGDSAKFGGVQSEAGSVTDISNVEIKYASGEMFIGPYNNLRGSIINNGGNLTASGLKITNGYDSGINHYSGTTTVADSFIDGWFDSVARYRSGDLKISNSSLASVQRNYSLLNVEDLGTPDVRNNWWGTAEGPYHETQNASGTAPMIRGNALFIPFLTSPPSESQTLDPVIIVPGIMGSALKGGEWIIDPIFHIYDNLVETLEKNGYVKEENLFTFGYDWRESNIETAEKLKEKIDEIKESTETEKVDIIAHSMGGLVARAYAQSSDYENDIDQLIFLGTPHRGAPEDYLTWEAGELARGLRGRFIRYHYSNEAKRLGFNNLFDYIRNWPIKSVKELLPIYDYLRDADSGEIMNYPDGYPENDFLENLNSGLVAFLESDSDVTNIIGDDGGNTISIIRITNEDRLPLWEDGYPEGYNEIFGDKGLEVGKGDGTVPEYSSSIAEALDIEIESSHVWLPSEAEEEIYKELSGKEIGETVKKSISSRISIFEIFSPADIAIIDPQGRMVGKDFETNEEINEIPGAFYSGFDTDNEFITIPDPVDGEYKIKLQGTGNGTYEVTASNVSEENISESNFTGFISENIEVGLDVNIENEDIDQIVPEDQMPPTITIKSPEEKDYLRSEKINISAEFSDDSGVASSSLMINKNFFENGDEYDPFFFNLGTTTLFATSTDYLNNTATTSLSFRIIANASSTISDINRLYGLGWIKKKEVKNSLIKQIELMTKFLKRVEFVEKKLPNGKIFTRRIERIERITDKLLAKIFLIQLDILLKQKIINQETHDILSEDIMWIINN